MAEKATTVTTFDNPFDPFEQFDDWLRFDEDHGYYTLSYLARLVNTDADLGEQNLVADINRAVDLICENDVFNMYYRVVEGEPFVPKTPYTGPDNGAE